MADNEDTRWLNESEREMWVRLVATTLLLPSEIEAQLKRDAGLTFFEYHVLAMLSEAEGQTRLMSDLARWANSSLSRLSHVVTRLEKHGWVRREASAEDRRATNAVLTDEGFAHLKAYAPSHVEVVRDLVIDRLQPEHIAATSEALGIILDAIQPGYSRVQSSEPRAQDT